MNKGLLIETHLFEAKLQQEENGTYLVKGILQRAGAANQNGRRYPREILERECAKYKQLIKERRALGELDHPDSPVINLKNVSHNIREIYWEGDDVCGVELKDGTVMVQEDFELVGWDFVSNPSTHGAFMAPMNESKQWAKMAEECGKWCKSQDLMREIIIELN